MDYPNWNTSKLDDFFVPAFEADIQKLVQYMDTDDRFFDLNPQTRYSGFVDVKPGKINYYRRKIAEEDSIEPVELHIFGDDEFRISDGRHRIYALHDAGFTVVKATVFLEEDMTPDFQKSVDEVIKKISP